VRRLSVIHSDGLTTVSSVSQVTHQHHHHDHDGGTDGQHHHGRDRDSVNTVTTMQTRASADAAPPARRNPWLLGCAGMACAMLAGVILAAIGSLPGFLIGVAVTGWFFWRKVAGARRWNADVYPGLHAAWERTFRCEVCGARFEASL
jgi:hypothetical protein